MATPTFLIMSGYGINCETETQYAFEQAGGKADIVHINDLIDKRKKLSDYQGIAFPGGFSFGDDTGSGKAFANRIRRYLMEDLQRFLEEDHLTIGICNGFQIMTALGIVPAFQEDRRPQVALTHNNSARYVARWVDVQFGGLTPWTENIGTIPLPIAHGEGKFYAPEDLLERLSTGHMIAANYVQGEICEHFDYPANPNGSLRNIAGITDITGKVLGMMPHPERALEFTNLPHWTWLKARLERSKEPLPTRGPGRKIFENGVRYFQ
ncbi:MAG: phosphoribosylformylglycinamidine synthase subunit PurQ [Nanoarchaeota archaeon]|nr:phosphoribosylformylglycinamidine synthase subunit PurQ [Nanoarchaeota archaeon]